MDGFTESNQDHSAPFHGYYSEISIETNNRKQQRAIYWNLILSESLFYKAKLDRYTGLKNSIQ